MGNWPKVNSEVLATLTPQERTLLEMDQEDLIRKSQIQLNQINQEMAKSGKGPYGKQYRLLKQDKQKLLGQLKASLSGKCSPNLTKAFVQMYEQVLTHKLELMSQFFRAQWNDDIKSFEHWQGVGKVGCALAVCLFVAGFVVWWVA